MNPTRQALARQAAALAAQGVYVGTSPWKHPGWCDMLYDRARYEGRFVETCFKGGCLAEYAVFFRAIRVNDDCCAEAISIRHCAFL